MKIINYPVYNHLYNLSKILALFVMVVEVINQDWIVDDVQKNMQQLPILLEKFVLIKKIE
jgi:predicted amidohydrolase